MALKDTLDQMYSIDTYRTVYPRTVEYTVFQCSWNILQDIPRGSQKISLSKLEKTEIRSSIFSNHNDTKLGINYKKKSEKTQT